MDNKNINNINGEQDTSNEWMEDLQEHNDPLFVYPAEDETGSNVASPEKEKHDETNDTKVKKYKHVCPKCSKGYRFKKFLQLHIKNNCDTFCCYECPKIFKSNYSLKLHSVCHRKTKDFKCFKCGKGFASENYLGVHMLIHNDHPSYECDICSATFKVRKSFIKHVKNHSSSAFCDECNKEFSNEKTLKRHRLNFHNGGCKFECETCDKKYPDIHGLKRHSKTHESKQFKCNICYKLFAYKTSLIDHHNIHTKANKYKCFTCGNSYTQPRTLREHVLSHSAEKQRCVTCARNFKNLESYEKHLEMHKQGFIKFSCKPCNLNFSCRSALNGHRKTHNKFTKSFRCGECEKVFKSKHNLKVHMMTHLDLRPVSCPHCNQKFRQKQHFVKHLQGVHKFNGNIIKKGDGNMKNCRQSVRKIGNKDNTVETQMLYQIKSEPELDL